MSPGEAFRAGLARAVTLPERWQAGVAYNPFTRRMADDPYPGYAALRERSPVHRSRLLSAWVVSRYADVDAILRDHRRFSTDPRKAALPRRQRRRLPPAHELTMLTLDPPDHTRLRALVSQAFTRARVNALEAHIRSIVGELLDAIDDPTGFDLMAAVAKAPAGHRDRGDPRDPGDRPEPVHPLGRPAGPAVRTDGEPARAPARGAERRASATPTSRRSSPEAAARAAGRPPERARARRGGRASG